MMRTLRISALTASLSLMLAACGGATSGLSNAVPEPLNPHPKGVLSVELNESVPENGTLDLTANGKTQILQKGDKLDTGFLKTDKVSSYDYAQKIKVNGQVITLETGDFQVYKQNYSTVAARYAKQKADDAGKLQNLDIYTFTVGEVQGDETAYRNLPKQGSYQYSGIAFNGDDRSGRLKYTVDFDKKQGYGNISSMASHNNVDPPSPGTAHNKRKTGHQEPQQGVTRIVCLHAGDEAFLPHPVQGVVHGGDAEDVVQNAGEDQGDGEVLLHDGLLVQEMTSTLPDLPRSQPG